MPACASPHADRRVMEWLGFRRVFYHFQRLENKIAEGLKARVDVYKAQNLGYPVHVKYLKDIEKKALTQRDE